MSAMCGGLYPHQVTSEHLQSIIRGWRAQGHARATVYSNRAALAKLCRFIDEQAESRLAAKVPSVPMPPARERVASPEEVTRLLQVAPRWLAAAILLAVHTGLRRSDVLRITPRQYDPQTQTLHFTQQKTGGTCEVPASPELAAMLAFAPHGDLPIIQILNGGRRISAGGLKAAWQRCKARAHVPRDLWFHDLRRTLAEGLYVASRDIRVVQQALGHANIATTSRYLQHKDPHRLRQIMTEFWKPTGRPQ